MAGWLAGGGDGGVGGGLEKLILMKTQSSVGTWTLDFDLGFVKKTEKMLEDIHKAMMTLNEKNALPLLLGTSTIVKEVPAFHYLSLSYSRKINVQKW